VKVSKLWEESREVTGLTHGETKSVGRSAGIVASFCYDRNYSHGGHGSSHKTQS
jgi:hypothetical protein